MPETMTEFVQKAGDILQYELFRLNDNPITPASFLVFLVLMGAFHLFSRIITRVILKRLLPRFNVERGMQYTVRRITHYVVMVLGALIAFQTVGVNLSGLAVIFGLLSVGIGFGLQNVTSNFISGIILLFEQPIRVGDRVTVGDTEGDVIAINMRATTISSVNNISIIVPNSQFISSEVINWSHGDPKIRVDVEVGVSYESDLDEVIQALMEVAEEHEGVLRSPAPEVLLAEFGDSSWNMILRAWMDRPKGHPVLRSQLHCAIVHKFRERGIEIPFPQRDLHVRSPLPLPHVAQA